MILQSPRIHRSSLDPANSTSTSNQDCSVRRCICRRRGHRGRAGVRRRVTRDDSSARHAVRHLRGDQLLAAVAGVERARRPDHDVDVGVVRVVGVLADAQGPQCLPLPAAAQRRQVRALSTTRLRPEQQRGRRDRRAQTRRQRTRSPIVRVAIGCREAGQLQVAEAANDVAHLG